MLQRALPKNEKKHLLKKDVSHLKIADRARNKRKTLKREKEKQKMRKGQQRYISFFTFTVLCRKILLENIFGKYWFLLLHLYYRFFSRGRLLEMK